MRRNHSWQAQEMGCRELNLGQSWVSYMQGICPSAIVLPLFPPDVEREDPAICQPLVFKGFMLDQTGVGAGRRREAGTNTVMGTVD